MSRKENRRCLRIRADFICCRRYEHEERNRIQRRDRDLPLLRMTREDCRLPWGVREIQGMEREAASGAAGKNQKDKHTA